MLSTISSGPDSEGFPSGSVVEYAVDDRGLPHFALSTLSPHTRDVQRDDRVSLIVPVQGSKVRPGRGISESEKDHLRRSGGTPPLSVTSFTPRGNSRIACPT